MTEMQSKTETALTAIAAASDVDALEEQRLAALGKKGWVSVALKTLGQMSPDERKERRARDSSCARADRRCNCVEEG